MVAYAHAYVYSCVRWLISFLWLSTCVVSFTPRLHRCSSTSTSTSITPGARATGAYHCRQMQFTAAHSRIISKHIRNHPMSIQCHTNPVNLPDGPTEKVRVPSVYQEDHNDTPATPVTKEESLVSDPLLKRKLLALSSSLFAVALFSFQTTQPVSNIGILRAMERDSPTISTALCNGKPTVIDFFADWCENCKVMAPVMRQLEYKYGTDINFIAIDGSDPRNSKYVNAFRVDGIPHLAFMSPKSEVLTALVGTVPKQILVQELDALAKNEQLPYEGYDAFDEGAPHPISLQRLGGAQCSSL